jgi:hypothetical protein
MITATRHSTATPARPGLLTTALGRIRAAFIAVGSVWTESRELQRVMLSGRSVD